MLPEVREQKMGDVMDELHYAKNAVRMVRDGGQYVKEGPPLRKVAICLRELADTLDEIADWS